MLTSAALAAPPQRGASSGPIVGMVESTGGNGKITYYRLDEKGKPARLSDVIVLDRNCTLTIDGKRGTYAGIERGHRVTIEVNPDNGRASSVSVESHAALQAANQRAAEARKQAEQDRADAAVVRGLAIARLDVEVREARQRRAEALRASYAEYLRQQSQAQRLPSANPPPSTGTFPLPSTPPTPGTTVAGVRPSPQSERYQRAVFKVAAATLAHIISQDPSTQEDVFGLVVAQLARVGRDNLIESALRDVFPDEKEVPGGIIRAIRRLICMHLDGELSKAAYLKQTAIDEVKAAIADANADAGVIVELADFVYAVVKAVGNR